MYPFPRPSPQICPPKNIPLLNIYIYIPSPAPCLKNTAIGVRLLGALRVWRVARVMNTALLSADAAHDDTLDKVQLLEKVRTLQVYSERTLEAGLLPPCPIPEN